MNLEQLEASISAAIQPEFRGQLLARGQARSIIWNDGVLADGAPNFSVTLSHDLNAYGCTLLSQGLRLRELGGDDDLARSAFENAGDALEALVSKGDPKDPSRGFTRLLAACAFHLGRFSARAFSLLNYALDDLNLSPMERKLALLVLRSLDKLEAEIIELRYLNVTSDQALQDALFSEQNADGIEDSDSDEFVDALDGVLNECFTEGLSIFLTALDSGDVVLVEEARAELSKGLRTASELNFVPQWWCFRLGKHLLTDLWRSSFHVALPPNIPGEADAIWASLRSLFIASLQKRKRSEIELWPSQIGAAQRVIDPTDDLVLSLPTSAGKTRIAELCILRCLADNKRIVFVTPLRALSAQTEAGLQKTFGPLGVTISALYGSIGTSGFEADALKKRDIVVATPEKLDFALRSDPTILDDVGLVVLDEGHMIGLGEREVRYEVQIQRLLKRVDADQRRIVCLSAILPDGDEFDDFVAWLRRDAPGEAISVDWRPTRLRFGEVNWTNQSATLTLRVGDESPWVRNFFGLRQPTSGRRRIPFPRDQRELVLATAWRLIEDGQSVLIYCPTRRSVEPFAAAVVDLASRGFLQSVLNVDLNELSIALTIGEEWLGNGNPILECLKLGVAIHHGALPTPFRKEIEALLRRGVLKVTVSSPTLAQGLNLAATTVIMQSLHRNAELLPVSEFKNVIGRAGRAFIDVEGLVLFPIFDNHQYRQSLWNTLIGSVTDHQLESGLLRLVITLLQRMNSALGGTDTNTLSEYVLNNAQAWQFPQVETEDADERLIAQRDWQKYLSALDTAILSLLGEQETDVQDIAAQLDDVLSSSLWQRRLARREGELRNILRASLISRATSIWGQTTSQQRKGYFLAGVGLETGQMLDQVAQEANHVLVAANGAIVSGDVEAAIIAITRLGEIIFEIPPFVPVVLPDNWRDILALWLRGLPLNELNSEDQNAVLRFVEGGLIYTLPWGIEALRVRAQANGDNFGDELQPLSIDDLEVGLAAPALETGTLNQSAALLIQAGFSSRAGAIQAVTQTAAEFTTSSELQHWLNSVEIRERGLDANWPTPESHDLWNEFSIGYSPPDKLIWSRQEWNLGVVWANQDSVPQVGSYLRLDPLESGRVQVFSSGQFYLGELMTSFAEIPKGVFISRLSSQPNVINSVYFGPQDLQFVQRE